MVVGSFHSARYSVIMVLMTKQETLITKKRGPKPTGVGTLIGVRLQPDQLAEIDAWATAQEDSPSRPEAIRRLVSGALKATILS